MSLSITQLNKIGDVVLSLIDKKKMFTIFDVVRLVEHKLGTKLDYQAARQEIVRLVEEEIRDPVSNYTTSTSYVNGQHSRIFHPNILNIAAYDPDHNKPGPKQVMVVVKQKFHGVKPTAQQLLGLKKQTVKTKNLRQTDKDGRLTIPVSMLTKFGFKKGSTVYVAARNNNQPGLVVLNKKPSTGLLTKVKLNASMRLRLAAGILKKSNLDLSNMLPKVTFTERAIVVSPGA